MLWNMEHGTQYTVYNTCAQDKLHELPLVQVKGQPVPVPGPYLGHCLRLYRLQTMDVKCKKDDLPFAKGSHLMLPIGLQNLKYLPPGP